MKEEVKDKNVKLLDKLEEEAVGLLDSFKQHPIKSIVVSVVVLWGIKKLYSIFKD